MISKEDLMTFASDAMTNPAVAKSAAGLTTVTGVSTWLGWWEAGAGIMASSLGIMVTIAIWRKLRLEQREAELRIQVLERKLSRNDLDSPLP